MRKPGQNTDPAAAFAVALLLLISTAGHTNPCEVINVSKAPPMLSEGAPALFSRTPSQLEFCDDRPSRWKLSWHVDASDKTWRPFGSAICPGSRHPTAPLRCVRKILVATGDGDETIETPYEIPLDRLQELYGVAKRMRPQEQVRALEHTGVADGGAWSEEKYGYQVKYGKPPDFEQGEIIALIRECDGHACQWTRPRFDGTGYWVGERPN